MTNAVHGRNKGKRLVSLGFEQAAGSALWEGERFQRVNVSFQ